MSIVIISDQHVELESLKDLASDLGLERVHGFSHPAAALDWCEINNEAHLAWQKQIAQAVGTAPDRVTLHTVHQHNAPIVDLEAQRIVEETEGLTPLMDTPHFQSCVERTAETAGNAARGILRRVTAVGIASTRVAEVASARRILGTDGKVALTRWSSTRDPALREAEGTIDPLLRTVTFLDGAAAVAAFHFYATHPMSYYGDGIVTADFAGLARERRCAETPGCEHIYLNGCGGDITAGKYNEGTPESRRRLSARIHDAMDENGRGPRVLPLKKMQWQSLPVVLPPRTDLLADALEATVRDGTISAVDRKTAALRLAYLRRLAVPTRVSRLRLGPGVDILCLPGEPFIGYQLFAAAQSDFVAVAGYGDTGTGYIPLSRSYDEGGYEIQASGVSAESEPILTAAIRKLLVP